MFIYKTHPLPIPRYTQLCIMSKFLLILADITFVCVIVVLGLERCMHIGNIVLTKYYIVSIYNIPTNTVTFDIRQCLQS